MALVPHKITALAESDAQGTDGKNIVAGAVVSLYDTNGTAVTLFDDENGTNGSTAKQTDATGQVVVYVTAGEYDEEVNGSIKRKVTIGGSSPIEAPTLSGLENLRPFKVGQAFICQERANAKYILQASGYTALAGDVTFANGRVGALQIDGRANVKWFGAKGDGINDDSAAFNNASSRLLSSGQRGVVTAGAGEFLLNSTFEIKGTGIRFEGLSGEKSTVLIGGMVNGPVLRCYDRYSGASNVEITSTDDRYNNGSGNGIRQESQDVQFFRPTYHTYKNITIRRQPNDAFVAVGACWWSEYKHMQVYDNGGHAFRFDNGELSGRTFKENPGEVKINQVAAYNNIGHALLIGDDNSVSNRGFRFEIKNFDAYLNATATGVRKTADQFWCFFDTSTIENSAVDGKNDSNAPTTAGMTIAGRSIRVENNRYLRVIRGVSIVEVLGYRNAQINVPTAEVFECTLDPFMTVEPNAVSITGPRGLITNVVSVIDEASSALDSYTQVIKKPTTQTINNSSTLTNDDDLFISMREKEVVQFKFTLIYRGDDSADIRLSLLAPSGATISYGTSSGLKIDTSGAVVRQNVLFSSGSQIICGCASSNNSTMIEIVGECKTNGTDGDLRLQWAQNVATVADTQILSRSFLEIKR